MRPARIRDSLANSLWLIPMLFAVGGAALALIALAIDSATDYDLIPQALTGPEAVAQTMLTTFIGALVTLISIVLTVAVQLAMQQFSPRIVRPLLKGPSQSVHGRPLRRDPRRLADRRAAGLRA